MNFIKKILGYGNTNKKRLEPNTTNEIIKLEFSIKKCRNF